MKTAKCDYMNLRKKPNLVEIRHKASKS